MHGTHISSRSQSSQRKDIKGEEKCDSPHIRESQFLISIYNIDNIYNYNKYM